MCTGNMPIRQELLRQRARRGLTRRVQADDRDLPKAVVTKTRPPRRVAGLIDRPRLLELLCPAQLKLLTVIKAAAGFGKTCLAASWAEHLQRSGHAVAWLSIDAGDDEPAQFLYSVAHVLRRAHHGMGDPAIDRLRDLLDPSPHDRRR